VNRPTADRSPPPPPSLTTEERRTSAPTCCGEVVGVERIGWYDGVAYWECMGCGKSFPRIDPPTGRWLELWERRLAELPYVQRAAAPSLGGSGEG
jgi:hypothetical protein